MKIIAQTGREDIACVYIAEMADGRRVEFVESVQPPIPRDKKWVLIISTLYGCPVRCRFCDAGGWFQGALRADEMFHQIDFLVTQRYPSKKVPVDKFKIQFARIGEPSYNNDVLIVIDELPQRYDAPGLITSLSTIAPAGRNRFFQELLKIKNRRPAGCFQFQFSLHTTDEKKWDWLVPVPKWSFREMADYGRDWFQAGDRKLVLNFALIEGMPLDPERLLKYFSPAVFLIKITPLNPTYAARANHITSHVVPERDHYEIIDNLRRAGYEVLLSIGEWEENKIGSNCGQYLQRHMLEKDKLAAGYTYAFTSRSSP